MSEVAKRRWFRFSLRTLFVLMTIAAAATGYATWKVKLLRKQSHTIAELEQLGVIISFQHELNRPPPVTAPGPKWLRRLLGEYAFATVVQIHADGDWVTDDIVRRAVTVPCKQALIFRSKSITDEGLTHLATISEVASLDIISADVTAAGISQLKGVKIDKLFLSYDTVTGRSIDDACMPGIAELGRVKCLWLNGTRITDAGLAHLHNATGLRELHLWQTKTTDGGVKKLRKALPNCKIYRLRVSQTPVAEG